MVDSSYNLMKQVKTRLQQRLVQISGASDKLDFENRSFANPFGKAQTPFEGGSNEPLQRVKIIQS